ncbi:hypothetical protein A1O3_07847 [Capronia epimyces CBS 606.96]|uniref:Uncharacterized protein n=1 Tax=Capronia epimyces CBS 606.96 TaxID=1182542 RepID=W9XH62_9EURO|nr:uncharacterized protein A1O3_07847 [Capronia epimyces CBS 606.96]EXJ79568.1 hypothetical protein A1O3_07847 [Capronia epimyces CBS 606.96]
MVRVNSDLIDVLHMEQPHAQHNADLIIQSLRSIPAMMIRRETFPWFIHPQTQLLLKGSRGALPEALATCMSLAQMFASRTPETSRFLWRSIKIECRRFTDEVCIVPNLSSECMLTIHKIHHMSIFESLATMQASMVYLTMIIVDSSREAEEHRLEFLHALHDLYISFKSMCGGHACGNELSSPSLTWEDWIFAESRRRLTNLWFLMSCAVCVKNGVSCDASQSYRSLPLPSSKSLWEAPTQSAWEAEYKGSRIFHHSGMVTLGDLLDVQQAPYMPSNIRKLDLWNAGIDNLGSLLNLVGTML